MTTIHINLRTRVLPKNHLVFMARPGKEYRFYHTFTAQSVVAPELPRLDLDLTRPLDEQPRLEAKVRRSDAIRRWHRRGRPEGEYPSLNLEDYEGKKPTASLSQLIATTKGYFERAKKGDLVVVPPAAFGKEAYIGEFSDGPLDVVQVFLPDRYGDDSLPARRVNWVARVLKRSLPDEVIQIVEKPNAFVLMPKSARDYFYRLAYGAYSVEQEHSAKFKVRSQKFTTSDDLTIQAFFNFVAANVRAIESHSGSIFGIEEAIFEDLGGYAPDLSTNINSPGTLSIASAFVVPLVAAALLALALHIDAEIAVAAAENGQIILGNSAAPPGDPCTAQVAEQVIHHIRMLGLDKWPTACEKARQVAESVGLESPASIAVEH